VKGLPVHNNVSRLPVRLVDSFTAPKDILPEFSDLTEEEMTYSTKGLHLVHKNVTGLVSEVGRLIYGTQRHSSRVYTSCRERK
jgi:hypothetical protein